MASPTERRCNRCLVTLPIEAFGVRRRQPGSRQASGHAYTCKPCYNAEGKRKWLHRKYRLTEESYAALIAGQGGGCAICGGVNEQLSRSRTPFPLGVDHDHVTTAVRGALCSDCNSGLGLFKDSPWLLSIAIAYLEAAEGLPPLPPLPRTYYPPRAPKEPKPRRVAKPKPERPVYEPVLIVPRRQGAELAPARTPLQGPPPSLSGRTS